MAQHHKLRNLLGSRKVTLRSREAGSCLHSMAGNLDQVRLHTSFLGKTQGGRQLRPDFLSQGVADKRLDTRVGKGKYVESPPSPDWST